MGLAGKTAVVTGGNSGIGAAIAQELSERGANVVIFGRNQETLESTLATLGGNAHAVRGDVTNMDDLDRLFAETQSKFGKLDVLVANAGVPLIAPLAETSEAQFDQVNDINFKGAFFTMQKGVEAANDGASIVLVSSVANRMGMAGMGAYAATKAAVRNLARTATAEYSHRGIRVNSLSPGPIQTPIFGKMGLSEAEVEGFSGEIMGMHPMKRFGTPEEMAKAAVFLASSDSSYVAGTDLVAGGGLGEI